MFIAEREKIISGQKLRMTFLDDSTPSLLPPPPHPPLLLLDKSLGPFCFTADGALLMWDC